MSNPLLETWTGPLGGVPPLDRVRLEHFAPALDFAMAEKRAQAQAIRDDPEPPSFGNTLEAMEQMGETLRRVKAVYGIWSSGLSTPAFRALNREYQPRLAELRDAIRQDPTLFARVQAVAELPGLSDQQARVCQRSLEQYRKAGAHLGASERARVAGINQRLSALYAAFSDNLLADEEGYVTTLGADQLAGLSPSWLASAAASAEELGHPGRWAVTNTRSSMEPFLMTSEVRELREAVWRTYYRRGDNGDASDNKEMITEILSLRGERARLLGFQTHAHLALSTAMAREPERAMALLRRIWEAAVTKFRAEVTAAQALADSRGDDIEVDRWDVRYYAELRRGAFDDFDPRTFQEHFQLDSLVQGMFWAATERFGWTFEPIDVPVPHPDITVWSVRNGDGTDRGLFYFDPFARRGKRSGAWMSAYRVQNGLTGELPLVSNNCNFTKAPAGEPTLLSLDDAITLFHEFGHAMHGLSSDTEYPMLAGTNVPRDYVEFPSQLNEHWLTTPELLHRFAKHRVTGEPPTDAMIARLSEVANVDSGFRTLEFLASAVMDMEMHIHTEPIDPAAFEDETLARWGLPREVVMRHRTPQFAHVFSGEGYSAGYYSYLWADTLVADAAEAFAEAGFYDVPLSSLLMDTVLSRGDTVEAEEGFRAFRGRDPEVEPLLRHRGLV